MLIQELRLFSLEFQLSSDFFEFGNVTEKNLTYFTRKLVAQLSSSTLFFFPVTLILITNANCSACQQNKLLAADFNFHRNIFTPSTRHNDQVQMCWDAEYSLFPITVKEQFSELRYQKVKWFPFKKWNSFIIKCIFPQSSILSEFILRIIGYLNSNCSCFIAVHWMIISTLHSEDNLTVQRLLQISTFMENWVEGKYVAEKGSQATKISTALRRFKHLGKINWDWTLLCGQTPSF